MQMALNKAIILQKEEGFLVQILEDYEEVEIIKYQLKSIGANILAIEYGEKVSFLLEISKQNYEEKLLDYRKRGKNSINLKILQKKFVDISTNTREI